jgi:DMSO/TMAO reductase YedYZ heme-binding membrane subunit
MNPQVWWFVARSSGIISWALVTLAVCWGLFLSTKAFSRAVSPAWLLDLHRYLGGLAVTFTVIHLVGIAADNYVTFGWFDMFVPMVSDWKPGAVAYGIVGLYLLLAIELTSLSMKRLPRRLWRWVHRTSFILYGIATYHAFLAGTDTDNGWFRIAAYCSIAVVVTLTVLLIRTSRGRPIPAIRHPADVAFDPVSPHDADVTQARATQAPSLVPPSLVPPSLVPPSLVPPSLVPPSLVPPSLVPPTLVPSTLVPPSLVANSLGPPTLVPPSLVPPSLVPPVPASLLVGAPLASASSESVLPSTFVPFEAPAQLVAPTAVPAPDRDQFAPPEPVVRR